MQDLAASVERDWMAMASTELAELNVADRDAFMAALGGVFENAPWVAERAWNRRPCGKVADLHHALMAFRIGAHFAERGVAASRPPFLDVVPIRTAIAEPEAHHHVPLLASPWAYSTYRGR